MTRTQGIAQLVAAQQALQQNPVVGLTNLIRQYGSNPQVLQALAQNLGLVQSTPAEQADEYVDPQTKAVMDQNAILQQQINGITGHIQQQAHNAQQTQTNSLQAEILGFENAKDDAGNPLHPHFETVKPMMGALMQAGQASDMKAAYEMAIYADATIRTDLIANSAAQTAKAEDVTRKAAVQKAKSASRDVGIERQPDQLNGIKSESMDDSIAAAYDSLT